MVILATVVAGALVVAQSDWGQETRAPADPVEDRTMLDGELSVRSLRWTLNGRACTSGRVAHAGRASPVHRRVHRRSLSPWRILTTGVAFDEVVVTRRRSFSKSARTGGTWRDC
jgi:hypothetical protein